MEEVIGSIPIRSTNYFNKLAASFRDPCQHFGQMANPAARPHSYLLSSPFSSPELDTFLPGDERKSSAQLQEKGFGLTQNSVLSCTIPAERLELPIARS
jgi:hypothetical protein